MFAHGLVAFMFLYILLRNIRHSSHRHFFRVRNHSGYCSRICSALAVVGIWSKDNVKYFKLDEDKKQQIHFRDYAAIIKHNKPIRMLVIAAASNKFAQMVYGNSTVLVMLYGILMQNYPLAGIIE